MSEQLRQIGKYELRRHLATGGMAEIWLAEQAGPGGFNKELVIKRILPHFADDEQFTTMFLDEARLAAQLSHPKIAQIYELGEIDGQYFIAMEYIPGIDLDVLLSTAMEKGEPIPIEVVGKVMMDVLEALDYAHDFTDRDGRPFNLVHRDVSPHNVLISNDGIVKLCDFGVAKAVANQTKTQPGAVKGKFAYMAPEQIQNAHSVDRRADVFAAGIMFFELLTGQKPFGDELAAVNNIIASAQPDPRTIREDIPAEIVAIINKALEKSRTERYPDAHAMMRDIEAYIREGGAFVGDRELSRYVRTMQGLPITRHSQPSVSVSDDGIDPLSDTGPQPLEKRPNTQPTHLAASPPETAQTPRVTNHEAPLEPNGEAHSPSNTVSADFVATKKKSFAALYGLFALIVIGVVAALGLLGYRMLGPTPATPAEQPKVVDGPTKPKANAELLRESAGKPVFIRSRPQSQIYRDGKLVGETPFQAVLVPGQQYDVEFRTGNKTKKKTVVITGKEASIEVTID